MGRRNLHTRDELHDLALRTASGIVEREGIAGLSMREVARRIGYTVGALYQVYANLDDLIVQVNERTVGELRRALEDVEAKSRLPGQRLRLLAAAYLGFSLLHANRWRLVFEHRLPPGQAAPATYRPQTQAIFALVGRSIAPFALAREGNATVEELASTLWSAVHGICVLAASSKLNVGSATSAQRQIDLLLDRLIGREGDAPSPPRRTGAAAPASRTAKGTRKVPGARAAPPTPRARR
jgi:AcrR family transcriptional regulator